MAKICISSDALKAKDALIEQLRGAVAGLLEIEDARIATGAFVPNAEATARIAAARAAITPST